MNASAAGPTACSWCGESLSQRSIFGSRRYGLDQHHMWACDACLQSRAFEMPPADSALESDEWSFHDPVAKARKGSPGTVLAFAIAVPIGCAIWAAFHVSDLGWPTIAGLTLLFALGGFIAFRRPLPTVRRSEAKGIGLTLGGFGAISILNRIGETYPLVAVAVMSGLALLLGWSSSSLLRISLAMRPGRALDPAMLDNTGDSQPPASRQ